MRTNMWMAAAGLALLAGLAPAQQILQEGFEAKGPFFKPGSADAVYKVVVHELTEKSRHGGQRSEHLRLQVEKGTYIRYVYDLPPAPINQELNVSLWLKSNRPGVQLLCRVVLPRERDPKNLNQNMTLLLRCDPYISTQWKAILLQQPDKRLREQQALLALRLKRPVDTSGAYIDQLVLNVLDGTGLIDVWVDDLEIGPVLEGAKPDRAVIASPAVRPGTVSPTPGRATEAVLHGKQLQLDGKPFFLRGFLDAGLPMKFVNEMGCNTVWLGEGVPDARIGEAARFGLRTVPMLLPLPSATPLAQRMARFSGSESVLGWYVGTNLDANRYTDTARWARQIQRGDTQRLLFADVWDGYRGYSRNLDGALVGTHRWPLFTSLPLGQYRKWLASRRDLIQTNYNWTWVQTHLPQWMLQQCYAGAGKGELKDPAGPTPEQIRLLTYITLAAGYRGVAFWSDRFLADPYQGRDRLLGLALLNQELKLLERILLKVAGDPEWVETDNKKVRCAIFRIPKTVLVLPVWVGPGSQYVPGQSAALSVGVRIPAAPTTGTAWEVTPGRIRAHAVTRTPMGAVVTLKNFSLASALVLTSDLSDSGVVVDLQSKQQRIAHQAAYWLHEQAKAELEKVERTQQVIAGLGHSVPDAEPLLDTARKALKECARLRTDRQHSEAYDKAEVALRSLRLLRRVSWDKATRDLDVPSSSPYALSYYTLPRHWQFLDEIRSTRAGASVLPTGDFEVPPGQRQTGWTVQEVPPLDPVACTVTRVGEGPHSGQQCVRLEVKPTDAARVPESLERTFIALHTPSVKLTPGSLVRISAWIRIPGAIRGSVDGVLFYDSIGGEPLAVRLTEPSKWKQYSLYRRVPASGQVHATMAMAGIGKAYFDDVKIEPLESATAVSRK